MFRRRDWQEGRCHLICLTVVQVANHADLPFLHATIAGGQPELRSASYELPLLALGEGLVIWWQ
jgi:hypothetical protein